MIALSWPFWDHQRLIAGSRALFLDVGDQAVLFDERAQQLFELNETSEAIWSAIALAGTIDGAARLLDDGAASPAVLAHVRSAAAEWIERGLLRPAAPPAEAGAAVQLRLAWLTCRMGLTLHGAIDPAPLRHVFSALLSSEVPDHWLDIRDMGGVTVISDADGSGCATASDAWIPEVKARFTQRILRSTTSDFLVHAALLSRKGEGLLICGDPGAGKTTLSVSLLTAGFQYHSDDIVRIDEAGKAFGAPFSPAIKAGAWPLVEAMAVAAPMCGPYLRGDGQRVKYLSAPATERSAVTIGSILLLARDEGGAPRIEPVGPVEVLKAVLGSAYASRGAISASALRALADRVSQARLGRLCFSDWRDARRLVETFAA